MLRIPCALLIHISIILIFLPDVNGDESARDVSLINESGFKCDIYWINRWKNDELVLNSLEGLAYGSSTTTNTFVGHEFEVQEVPSKRTKKCRGPDNACRKIQYKVNSNYGQSITLKKNLEKIIHTDDITKARDEAKLALQKCKSGAIESLSDKDPDSVMTSFLSCVDKSVEDSLEKKKEELEFQDKLRTNIGSELLGYSCLDPNVTMSEGIENKTWEDPLGKSKRMRMLFDQPTTKILYVEDFASEDECRAMEETVTMRDVDEEGGLHAKKGSIKIPLKGGKISLLVERMRSLVFTTLRTRDKAERLGEISMIHYEENLEDPRRFDSHCDGKCDGSIRQSGDYIASVLVYCATSKKGGHSHFSNSGIHIIPEVRSAIMYSYFDPQTNKHDSGYSNLTECSVLEGEKKVIEYKIKI